MRLGIVRHMQVVALDQCLAEYDPSMLLLRLRNTSGATILGVEPLP